MNPKQAMRQVTKSYKDEGATPYQINNGSCEGWANEVFDLLEKTSHKIEVWETPFGFADTTHIFLRIDGLFYDAECPKGHLDHMDLPIFKKLFKELNKRQPVWLLHHNQNGFQGEDKRDMDEKMVAEYHKVMGN